MGSIYLNILLEPVNLEIIFNIQNNMTIWETVMTFWTYLDEVFCLFVLFSVKNSKQENFL